MLLSPGNAHYLRISHSTRLSWKRSRPALRKSELSTTILQHIRREAVALIGAPAFYVKRTTATLTYAPAYADTPPWAQDLTIYVAALSGGRSRLELHSSSTVPFQRGTFVRYAARAMT